MKIEFDDGLIAAAIVVIGITIALAFVAHGCRLENDHYINRITIEKNNQPSKKD